MIEKTESFVFYASYYECIKLMPKPEDKIALLQRICEYALFGIDNPSESEIVEIGFQANKKNIDISLERRRRSIENGKLGGAPKGNANAKKKERDIDDILG